MKPLALIPARIGSKRLPGKNWQTIGGQTLVAHAAVHAMDAGIFEDHIIITSDAEPPIVASTGWRGWTIQRPPALAQDDTPMMDVVRHALDRSEVQQMDWDCLILLQPTSPLRTAADILAAVDAMENHGWEAVVSVVEAPAPELYSLGHANRLRAVWDTIDKRRLMIPNGAIFGITRNALLEGADWWTARLIYGLEMPPERSVDIDTQADFEKAVKLWTERS